MVLKIFVKLPEWHVPLDGSVMRLQSQWVDVLGAPVWSVNTLIDCSLWAECWAGPTCLCSMNWYWMSMKRRPWNVTATLCWDCHSTEYFSEYSRWKIWERRDVAPYTYCSVCTFTLRENFQNFFLKVSKEQILWMVMMPRNMASICLAFLEKFHVYSAQSGIHSWFSNISHYSNEKNVKYFYRVKI